MKLIDKDALVAEIERRIEFVEKRLKNNISYSKHGEIAWERDKALYDNYNSILSFLDTLEAKKVDLDYDVDEILELCDWNYDKIDFRQFAKHFFELGLKAQHDNWKVVNNINPPQADKDKIYCVFTRDRYILAKVINHPNDEELLQWKCTGFPHHRYDICEGDKYMQIV